MASITDLGLCIERINAAKTPEQAFDVFCGILESHGYNRITYSLVTDHPSLELPQQHGLATSYPDDWMKHYRDNQYLAIDPVVENVLTTRKPFFWQDLIENPKLPKDSFELMKQAEDAGVYAGIGFSLTGVGGEVVGVGLARDTKSDEGKDHEFLASAHLLSTYFHETYRDLILQSKRNIKITNREYDILCWAAEGKSNDEIAIIVGISINTVRFHWKNIFAKLNANGRLYAVTKAIRLGLIKPRLLHIPYSDR